MRLYDDILTKGNDVAICLTSQNYKEEITDIEHKYGLPFGRLYIVFVDGKAAGCGALRMIDEVVCEINRLYVRPQYRGLQIGKMLTERIIADGRAIGYKQMRLDTFPFMVDAIQIYANMDFMKSINITTTQQNQQFLCN
ncbi:GNAT family N-acetyltransferase [Oscillospiraceae bacterium LTW-04]|nr:GNAT family N-acetyltransferase [Oscillospiraceae bacterium MB24-C1]